MSGLVRQPKEISRETVSDWEKRYPALKALNDATLNQNRGYCLSKETAWKLAGGERDFKKIKPRWDQCLMWLRGITVEYDHAAKGYRLVGVDHHLTKRRERVQKGIEKRCRMEALRLGLIRDDDFEGNDHLRQLRAMSMSQLNDTAGKVAAQRDQIRIAVQQPETLPKIVNVNAGEFGSPPQNGTG